VLTCLGDTFPGRVGASLSHALRMPELVANSLMEYETRAVEIGSDPEKARDLRRKLAERRRQAPFFNSVRFARTIESAYVTMYERHRRGLAPDHFSVEPDGSEALERLALAVSGRSG